MMLQHLVEDIGFQRKDIKHITQSSFDDYAKALSTGNITAAFFRTPDNRFLLTKYCTGFGNPNCNLHGSSLCNKNHALSVLVMLICCSSFQGLSFWPFWASAIALLITVIPLSSWRWKRLVQGMLMSRGLWVLLTTLFCRKKRGNQLQLQRPRI